MVSSSDSSHHITLRQRLGGRRAISWQAVIIGDALIVFLATILAAASPGSRSSIDAASDAFAITAATAIIAAIYTGIAHLTVFRNRQRHPVPVAVMVGFHLSIGVIFLIGFVVGAAILGIPQFGGSVRFSIAVLAGGLMVCIPTALLLDGGDRYRQTREELIRRVVDLERLRISEWSLRRSLRVLVGRVSDERTVVDLTDRLDALDLSEDTGLATTQLWEISQGHHREQAPSLDGGDSAATSQDSDGETLSARVSEQVSQQFPLVRWPEAMWKVPSTQLKFPLGAALLALVMVWVILRIVIPSSVAVPIAITTAVGVYVTYRFLNRGEVDPRWKPSLVVVAVAVWGGLSAFAWIGLLRESSEGTVGGSVAAFVATAAAAAISAFLVGWVSAVQAQRDEQVATMQLRIDRRWAESAAVIGSLVAIVTKMAGVSPLSNSPAIAASAAGLQRVQRDMSPQQARRIIDWTDSVVSAPGVLPAVTLEAQLDEVVHPWRALADVVVDCQGVDGRWSETADIVAIVDEGVRNACRHGDADNIRVSVSAEGKDAIRVEVVDDGVGLGQFEPGMGFERFALLGTLGFEVSNRESESGTRLMVTVSALDRNPP